MEVHRRWDLDLQCQLVRAARDAQLKLRQCVQGKLVIPVHMLKVRPAAATGSGGIADCPDRAKDGHGLVLGLAVADGEVNLEAAESSAEPAGDLGRRIELEIEQDRGSLGAKVLELTDAGLEAADLLDTGYPGRTDTNSFGGLLHPPSLPVHPGGEYRVISPLAGMTLQCP